jgi:integrase
MARSTNTAKGVPKIRRSRSAGIPNKAWLPGELHVLLTRAAKWRGLRKAIALAYYTGLRKKDCVEIPEEARSETGAIEWVQSKTGRQLTVFEAKRLTEVLNETDTGREADTIVVTKRGQTYTRDGLDTMFHRLKTTLAEEGLIRKGLTFHGLRKSLGRDLAAAGMSENDIAGALGHANPASARPYTAEHKQREAARKATKLLERRGKR